MKFFEKMFLTLMFLAAVVATAEETVGEKIETSANNVKRSIKRTANKIDESLCNKGTAKCAGKKVKNRATEMKDATVDGAVELKNKVD